MILDAIRLIDCLVFVVCLIPQLFYQAGFFATLLMVLQVLPFLVFKLPIQFCHERYFKKKDQRSPFCQNASFFQDLVIRCVRFAFANIPAAIGRVFFSKWVALPFFRFRLLRNGYLKSPVFFKEIERGGVKGIWATFKPNAEPDIIIYYCHGGGFSMGSAYFYLEFLIAWATCLKDRGFSNPAVFALEYTLVPDETWPTQFNEIRDGYKFLLDSFGEGTASKICVSGDSAGATLVLSMLLHPGPLDQEPRVEVYEKPGLAILLSPWTHLVSDLNKNTASDYLDKDSLHRYAKQYAGEAAETDAVVAPGLSRGRWGKASPLSGYRIMHGSEEVFTSGIQEMVKQMKIEGATVEVSSRSAGIHAWPVVNLFLGETREERLSGLRLMTDFVFSSNMASLISPTKRKKIPKVH